MVSKGLTGLWFAPASAGTPFLRASGHSESKFSLTNEIEGLYSTDADK